MSEEYFKDVEYDLELDRVIKEIKKNNAKLVCIQLPDGLKPKALEIVKAIEENTKARCLVWMESNFGACDLPIGLEKLNVDMLIHFGHSSDFEKTF